MSDSLEDILQKRKKAEVPEIAIIQSFVIDLFQVKPSVTISDQTIIIGVSSAGLAGALRPHILQIQAACNTTKRIIIRIG